MDSLEQAREALIANLKYVWSQLTPGAIERADLDGMAAIVEQSIAALSRPVEGVKGEPVAALERLVALAEDYERAIRALGGEVVDAYGDMDFARTALTGSATPPVADSEALRERAADAESRYNKATVEIDALERRAEAAEARLAQAERGPAVTEDGQ